MGIEIERLDDVSDESTAPGAPGDVSTITVGGAAEPMEMQPSGIPAQDDESEEGEAEQAADAADKAPADKPGEADDAEQAKAKPADDEDWKATRELQRQLWRREKELKEREAKLQESPAIASPKDLLRIAREKGISLEKLVDAYVEDSDGEEPAAEAAPNKELEEIRQWKAEQEKREQQRQYEQAMATLSDAVKQIDEAEDTKGELQALRAYGAYDAIVEKVRSHQEEFGEALDWREAAKQTEQELRDRAEKTLEALIALPMFAGRYAKVESDDQSQSNKTNGARARARKTLTNDAAVSGRSKKDIRLSLDPDERDAQIRKMMGW